MDQREFRNTLGQFATGVTVITTIGDDHELIGLTANAFSSLSLEPPLILVCIDKKSGSAPVFVKEKPFVVNILTENQEDECWAFAKKGTDKFKNIAYTLSEFGVPIIEQNLATIECEVNEVLEGGDHLIVTGLVKNVQQNDIGEPLIFFKGRICRLNSPSTI
ncbi:flavin reductase family protein [Anaerobacillus isosaccharinicus]|uniref:Flavin reductase family protein n=1 Tax=Anaerobacillus isosaccharinicus TaxID=1532552 RepID=A0A1S2M985_9BACI|nr:flavin reductase family protein [Anaerobacillus isosaccharinicus]MBA5587186.1 flavin reductase family protein [Anaerobacillus isosaccharinicus]QOY34618.1 flavin reductase family protein [Anaerobacillus isosaccharinicus]